MLIFGLSLGEYPTNDDVMVSVSTTPLPSVSMKLWLVPVYPAELV